MLFFAALISLFRDQAGWILLVAFLSFLIASVFILMIVIKPAKKLDIVLLPENPASKESPRLYEKRGMYYVSYEGTKEE